jgi:hypothetical protein
MIKKIFPLIALLVMAFNSIAQLKSPQEFLGYALGDRYTPHWKIISYFEYVAAQQHKKVKLIEYGRTVENKPLIAAFIASETNLENLEGIRMNNLRLANIARDKMAPNENTPAIVWMSYNVHGNETSSSEAAMQTLYSLVDPSNKQSAEWLNKTIVVIDPCINPDGRDRYVNWFTSVKGKHPNALMYAREHREPWPGGRTNHYYFDLNRDWVWQTQVESQARMKLYLDWMPQVHVDYHEQGIEEPYYFPPAAEPYHEVITPWQREFQQMIGKNHAKYFDQNGWLYFTKLRFDLLYPSYGDTYPTYNGAIGMTYEQGGIGAGLAAFTSSGDSLTLRQRIDHHFTTGMSTIELCAAQSSKLIKEYRRFFNKAVQDGYGNYKSFVIKYKTEDDQRIRQLLHLLDINGIRYETGTGSATGYNYQTGKQEKFSVNSNDILISVLQPRSAMVKVLFEPQTYISDSATYDITAWSLPYAYGLTAYASSDKIKSVGSYSIPILPQNKGEDVYGYVIRWNGVQSAKVAGLLLQKGILLRYNEQPFVVNGKQFDRGSIIILKTGNQNELEDLALIIKECCDSAGVFAEPITTGLVEKGDDFGSDRIHEMYYKEVVLLTGEGVNANAAGAVWHFFDQELEYPVTLVNTNDFQRINWEKTDVLIMSDGWYGFLNEKEQSEKLRNWIEKGGKLVAIDGGAIALSRLDWGLKLKKNETNTDKNENFESLLKSYENRERDELKDMTAGSVYEVEMDLTHPLAFGYGKSYFTLKQDEHLFELIKENGWNVGVIKKEALRAGFVGANLKSKLKEGLLFGEQLLGNGKIVYLSDDVLFRSFWQNGKLLLCNAMMFN